MGPTETSENAQPRRHGPAFDQKVPEGGYLWWYLDGLSEDGAHAISVIAFIGSVFSPYYGWSGRSDPRNHCCINVALYEKRRVHWTMTERGRDELTTRGQSLKIGPSALDWQNDRLVIDIDEVTFPWPSRVRGRITVTPRMMPQRNFILDPAGRHFWQPIAPEAMIEVALERPGMEWRGSGYLDSNHGAEPLAAGFRHWSWSRAHLRDRTMVIYDAEARNGAVTALALGFDRSGNVETLTPPPLAALPRSFWRLARPTRSDAAGQARVRQTLIDAPFYSRSLIETVLQGESCLAFHESLDLDRFRSQIVQVMLPFRMPRRAG